MPGGVPGARAVLALGLGLAALLFHARVQAEDPPAPPPVASHPLQSEHSPGAPLDVVLLIDASEESATSSGADVNGDGRVDPGKGLHLGKGGVPRLSFRTGGDSILSAELFAARRLLAHLGEHMTRIGVVLMAQPFDPHPCEMDPKGPGAEVLQPLTFDHASVAAALDRIATRHPGGASNLAEGLRMSASMLTGLSAEGGRARAGARRVILFLGYRAPTFPFGSPYHTSAEDIALAERAAAVVGRAGIRLEVLAFGMGNEGFVSHSLERFALLTGGTMTRVPDARRSPLAPDLP